MQPSELLAANGTVSPGSTGGSGIYATYTTAGDADGETWRPQFVYHGYRYIQVTGLPTSYTPTADTVTAVQTYADNASASTLETSDPLVNTIRRMSRYSIMSNMQSIFTDCPHREKLGWLADVLQSLGSIGREYDVAAHLRLMVRHMVESQQADGLVPDIAPEMTVFTGGFRNDPNWGAAVVLTPYQLYKVYGDRETMRRYYPQMKAYLSYLQARATNGVLIGDLADWAAADTSTPALATGTYAYFNTATAMAQMAAALGNLADAAGYTALADSIAAAFNARFFNPATHSYTTAGPAGTTGSQAMNAMPLDMGIVPPAETSRVLDDLVARIRAYRPNGGGPHISAGMVSLQAVFRSLSKYDRDEFLWEVFKEPTQPSYAYFVSQGRTTIPEFWDLRQSQNHMILLQIDEWFSAGLAGIEQAPDSVGFDSIVIKPRVVGDLERVNGSYDTPHGTVRSQWTRDAQGVQLKVTVPANTTAKVYVPAAADEQFVGLGGVAIPVGREPKYQVFEVAPGEVTFQRGTSTTGTVGGTVPATLALTLGNPAGFGSFAPGITRDYAASTTATVISTAGDAVLSVQDPSATAPGRLVNGSFALRSPLLIGGSPLPAAVRSYSAPASNDVVPIAFTQPIDATEPLRTGSYSKTLTFTLATTNP
jgi:alpha-L-rhamnosidase